MMTSGVNGGGNGAEESPQNVVETDLPDKEIDRINCMQLSDEALDQEIASTKARLSSLSGDGSTGVSNFDRDQHSYDIENYDADSTPHNTSNHDYPIKDSEAVRAHHAQCVVQSCPKEFVFHTHMADGSAVCYKPSDSRLRDDSLPARPPQQFAQSSQVPMHAQAAGFAMLPPNAQASGFGMLPPNLPPVAYNFPHPALNHVAVNPVPVYQPVSTQRSVRPKATLVKRDVHNVSNDSIMDSTKSMKRNHASAQSPAQSPRAEAKIQRTSTPINSPSKVSPIFSIKFPELPMDTQASRNALSNQFPTMVLLWDLQGKWDFYYDVNNGIKPYVPERFTKMCINLTEVRRIPGGIDINNMWGGVSECFKQMKLCPNAVSAAKVVQDSVCAWFHMTSCEFTPRSDTWPAVADALSCRILPHLKTFAEHPDFNDISEAAANNVKAWILGCESLLNFIRVLNASEVVNNTGILESDLQLSDASQASSHDDEGEFPPFQIPPPLDFDEDGVPTMAFFDETEFENVNVSHEITSLDPPVSALQDPDEQYYEGLPNYTMMLTAKHMNTAVDRLCQSMKSVRNAGLLKCPHIFGPGDNFQQQAYISISQLKNDDGSSMFPQVILACTESPNVLIVHMPSQAELVKLVGMSGFSLFKLLHKDNKLVQTPHKIHVVSTRVTTLKFYLECYVSEFHAEICQAIEAHCARLYPGARVRIPELQVNKRQVGPSVEQDIVSQNLQIFIEVPQGANYTIRQGWIPVNDITRQVDGQHVVNNLNVHLVQHKSMRRKNECASCMEYSNDCIAMTNQGLDYRCRYMCYWCGSWTKDVPHDYRHCKEQSLIHGPKYASLRRQHQTLIYTSDVEVKQYGAGAVTMETNDQLVKRLQANRTKVFLEFCQGVQERAREARPFDHKTTAAKASGIVRLVKSKLEKVNYENLVDSSVKGSCPKVTSVKVKFAENLPVQEKFSEPVLVKPSEHLIQQYKSRPQKVLVPRKDVPKLGSTKRPFIKPNQLLSNARGWEKPARRTAASNPIQSNSGGAQGPPERSPQSVLPGKVLSKGVVKNDEGFLPDFMHGKAQNKTRKLKLKNSNTESSHTTHNTRINEASSGDGEEYFPLSGFPPLGASSSSNSAHDTRANKTFRTAVLEGPSPSPDMVSRTPLSVPRPLPPPGQMTVSNVLNINKKTLVKKKPAYNAVNNHTSYSKFQNGSYQ